MLRTRTCLVAGAMAVGLGLTGVVTVTAAPVSSTTNQAAQCPPGYTLNPQNTQQCIPADQTGMTPGAPSMYGF